MTALLQARDLRLAFGGLKAADGIDLDVEAGEFLASSALVRITQRPSKCSAWYSTSRSRLASTVKVSGLAASA